MGEAGIRWQELDDAIAGHVDSGLGSRGAYATDASVYQSIPRAVAFPRTERDLETILQFAKSHRLPMIGRGAGTSLSGQAIGTGIVVDFSRFMDGILDVDVANQTATVQPGVVLDKLNADLAAHRLHFAPDPATASRATVGGMIGNNACGTRSIVFGRTCDSIDSLKCLLADGGWLTTRWMDPGDWARQQEGDAPHARLYAAFARLIDRFRPEIQQRIPRLPRIAAGYSLQSFVAPRTPMSLSDLIVGSEGTLALVAEATVRLRPLPGGTALVISQFASIDAALKSLPDILRHRPSAIELLDQVLLAEAVQNAATRELAKVIVSGSIPQAVLMVEFMGDSEDDAAERAKQYIVQSGRSHAAGAHHVLSSAGLQKKAWDVRRLGLGLISNIPGKAKSIALIEDACIPIDRLPEYNRFVFEAGNRLGLGISTYAHASVGVLHYKVMLDLHEAVDRLKMRELAEACFEKCLEVGGVFSGEHGDGIVRGEFLKRQFGPELYAAFVAVKQLWDPQGLFNPGRKIDAPPLDRLLRYGDGESQRLDYLSRTANPSSRFRYGVQGDIVGAIEQCNGVGACRQLLKGTMCPSYRATRDERDSTRGRANLLRLAISGQIQPPGLANPDLHQALDLCLSCKACKSECPNAVDMARLKAEAQQVKWREQGESRQARFFAQMPELLGRWSPLARGVGWLARFGILNRALSFRYGLDSRRSLPRPAIENFNRWWRQHQRTGPIDDRTVLLFVDAWNRFLEPEIAIDVVQLLGSCGYRVEIAEPFDALRTHLSVGLLDQAAKRARPLFESLDQDRYRSIPILCIEPSEASALKDDVPDLIDDPELGRRVGERVQLLDDFLAKEVSENRCRLEKKDPSEQRSIIVHTHCHQQALFRSAATQELLAAAGFATELPDLGCCGMAGSFGYTHFKISEKIAHQRFLPAITAAHQRGSIFVATGTSCRQQAVDLLGQPISHWAGLVRGAAH